LTADFIFACRLFPAFFDYLSRGTCKGAPQCKNKEQKMSDEKPIESASADESTKKPGDGQLNEEDMSKAAGGVFRFTNIRVNATSLTGNVLPSSSSVTNSQ
jgi:hypothetical protein